MPETNALKSTIENLLKTIPNLATENGELKINKIKEEIENSNPQILEVLLKNKSVKKEFFTPVLDSFIFKTREFKEFLDFSFACNSYSKYLGKKIGLYFADEELTDNTEVVLNFPFKDCVLEGGQTKEDGLETFYKFNEKTCEYEKENCKRKEIFYNQILARDEIDSLFSPKAFTNAKVYDKTGQKACTKLNRDAEINKKRGLDENTITDNLIIKGNNLLALHSLKEEFAGKVKLVYIDPPFNTGKDSFVYNDKFSRSSWLTFMKNRLEVAKDLLKEDGSIFVHVDENQSHYIKILLDSIFYEHNFMNEIIWRYRTYIGQVKDFFPKKHDTIFWYKKNLRPKFNQQVVGNMEDTPDYKRWEKFLTKDGEIIFGKHPETDSRFTAYLRKYEKQFGIPKKGDVIYKNEGYTVDDVWEDIIALDAKNKTERINSFSGSGQKPEALLERILTSITQPSDIVLDYHLGSGTTAAVAHKMGRQFIGVEQMDYIKTISVERLKKVIEGEQGGISKAQNWQGGGSFVYFELAQKNQKAVALIQNCSTYDELVLFFDELCKKYFLHYNVKINEFLEEIKLPRFKELPLEKQKEMFCRMLDLNQLYVNFSDRTDKSNNLTKDDISFTENFYSSL